MKLFDLLEYAQAEAKKADDMAHDMSTGESINSDFNRTCAWVRAVAFYEMSEYIKEMLGIEDRSNGR